MDFSLTPEQIALKRSIVEFAEATLNDDLERRDLSGEFPRGLWRACAAFGIQSLSVPAQYSGAAHDTDILSGMLAMEALGYGCRDTGLTFALSAQMWTVQLPIARFGSEAQKRRYLGPMCAGECIGAHAITEEHAGSDVFSMQTLAARADGGYCLSGEKWFVSLAGVCDVALVFATVDPSLGRWGISAFLVDMNTAGVSAGESVPKMGLRTVPMARIVLDDCFVPDSARLGPEGAGGAISSESLELERCCILASQLGALQRQLERTIEHARGRRQFKQSIGKFQSVANRIADMRLRLETARLLLYKTAWLESVGEPAALEASLLKLHLSESFIDSSLDAVRTFGGRGYLSEHEVERDLRDAVGGILYAGTSDIQRNLIARLLGL